MSSQAETRSMRRPSLLARLKTRILREVHEPNPIWIRELKQSIRRGYTPVALMLLTALMSLLLTSVGGTVGAFRAPASTGTTLYQTFFSLAYFVVLLLSPALAANSVVSEREGRTWEAVILTGMRPSEIARGKFLAAFTSIALYIVALAPVGALPFLFGGTTMTEVLLAFAYLFAFAALGVSFGLAVSSKMQRLGAAIVTTLLLALFLATTGFSLLGMALSFAVHELWPRIPEAHPVWLPMAYGRADFGLDYLLFLVLAPVAGLGIPAWFSYEATVANLTNEGDDRSTGLKRWFVASTATLALLFVAILFRARSSTFEASLALLVAYSLFLAFCVFVFTGEPLGPSRRVRGLWARAGASRLERFFGPGLLQTTQLVFGVGVLGFTILALAGVGALDTTGRRLPESLLVAVFYAACFFTFATGFSAFMRARSPSPGPARITTTIVIFLAFVAPWLVAATAGALSDTKSAIVVAAPSPLFVAVMIDALGSRDGSLNLVAGLVSAAGWAIAGGLSYLAASSRCRAIISEHDRHLAESDAILEAEDRARELAEAAALEGSAQAP